MYSLVLVSGLGMCNSIAAMKDTIPRERANFLQSPPKGWL